MGGSERNAEYWGKRAIYHALSLLPTDLASRIGSEGIRRNVRLNRPEIIANARANLARHRPGATPEQLDAWVEDFLDGVGRIMAEFSVIHRFLREGRLQVEGLEAFRTLAGREPIIAIGTPPITIMASATDRYRLYNKAKMRVKDTSVSPPMVAVASACASNCPSSA